MPKYCLDLEQQIIIYQSRQVVGEIRLDRVDTVTSVTKISLAMNIILFLNVSIWKCNIQSVSTAIMLSFISYLHKNIAMVKMCKYNILTPCEMVPHICVYILYIAVVI